MFIHPSVDLTGVEADELADLQERHAVLGDESADEPLGNAELDCERRDVDEAASTTCCRADSPNYEPAAKSEFASAADSFLIGHAVAGGHTVVTHEVISDGRRRIKIPNAAAENGVRNMNPFQMLRAEGARFVLTR